MIRLILLIFVLGLSFSLLRQAWSSTLWQRLLYRKSIRFAALILGILVLLALSGKLGWLLAALGLSLTFIIRNLPILLRYAQYVQRWWQTKHTDQRFENTQHAQSEANLSGKMTYAQAYNILGLTPPVSKQEIIMAHKKLMQKMHPDRGGSVYLASQINRAKDFLLKNAV